MDKVLWFDGAGLVEREFFVHKAPGKYFGVGMRQERLKASAGHQEKVGASAHNRRMLDASDLESRVVFGQ